MSFWAVEITPGNAFETLPPFDLHVTQIVLPANATDKGRTVVQCKVGDKTFALGSLKLDLQENLHTDLIFDADIPMELSIAAGKNPVQLLGYYVDQGGFGSDDEDLSDDEDDEEGEGMMFDEDEMGSDDDEDGVNEDELTGATLQALTKRKADNQLTNGAKKTKVEEPKGQQQQPQKGQQKPQTPKGDQKPQQAQQPKGEAKAPQPKGEQKPQTPKGEQKPQQPKGEKQQQQQQPKKQQQTPGKTEAPAQKEIVLPEGGKRNVKGVTVQTTTIGLGTAAALGNKVGMMYVGRLENGKVFDKSVKPLVFNLGLEEVIKGWDIGINGMRVGEKRKLIIPPKLAYGAKGMPPDIPRNATLEFDVELVRVYK